MTRAPKIRAPRIPERVVQQQVVHLLRSLGGQVWVLGTVRPRGDTPGTRQTPGVGDLFACLRGRALWVEVKAQGGRLRPEQAVFRAAVLETPCHHVVGGLDAVIAWLVAEGLLRADSVPHYRLADRPPAKSGHGGRWQARREAQGPDCGSVASDCQSGPSEAANRSVSQSAGTLEMN